MADEKAATENKPEYRDITHDGYTFKLDDTLLDDVEVLEMIDAVESQNRPGEVIRLLKQLIGDSGYAEMKAYFVKKDGRFKMTKMMKIYEAIFEGFDPKG
jgi:hypothetical protein